MVDVKKYVTDALLMRYCFRMGFPFQYNPWFHQTKST